MARGIASHRLTRGGTACRRLLRVRGRVGLRVRVWVRARARAMVRVRAGARVRDRDRVRVRVGVGLLVLALAPTSLQLGSSRMEGECLRLLVGVTVRVRTGVRVKG